MSKPQNTASPLAAKRKRGTGAERPHQTMCLRCLPHWVKDQTVTCAASFAGSQTKKCVRCGNGRHPCEEMTDPAVIKMFNAAERARVACEEYQAQSDIAEEEPDADTLADLEQRRQDACAALVPGLRAYHGNKNKMTGDKRTPRKGRAAAPLAGGLGGTGAEMVVVELQQLNRSVAAFAEGFRAFLGASGADTTRMDRILRGGNASDSDSEEDDDDDDDDDDGGPPALRRRFSGGDDDRRSRDDDLRRSIPVRGLFGRGKAATASGSTTPVASRREGGSQAPSVRDDENQEPVAPDFSPITNAGSENEQSE